MPARHIATCQSAKVPRATCRDVPRGCDVPRARVPRARVPSSTVPQCATSLLPQDKTWDNIMADRKAKRFWLEAFKPNGSEQTNMKEATRNFQYECLMRHHDKKERSATLWRDRRNAAVTPSILEPPRLHSQEHWAPGTEPLPHTRKLMFPAEGGSSDDSSSDDSSSDDSDDSAQLVPYSNPMPHLVRVMCHIPRMCSKLNVKLSWAQMGTVRARRSASTTAVTTAALEAPAPSRRHPPREVSCEHMQRHACGHIAMCGRMHRCMQHASACACPSSLPLLVPSHRAGQEEGQGQEERQEE